MMEMDIRGQISISQSGRERRLEYRVKPKSSANG